MTQEERLDIVYHMLYLMPSEMRTNPIDVLKQALIGSVYWFGTKADYYGNVFIWILFLLYSCVACILVLPMDLLLCGRYLKWYLKARKLGYDGSYIQWQNDLIHVINI